MLSYHLILTTKQTNVIQNDCMKLSLTYHIRRRYREDLTLENCRNTINLYLCLCVKWSNENESNDHN